MSSAMSASGHKQTCALQNAKSALPPKATTKADMPRAAILRAMNKPRSGTRTETTIVRTLVQPRRRSLLPATGE